MATGGNKRTGSELLNFGTLTVKPDDLDPWGVVVVGDKLVITDRNSKKVHVYRRHDGMLLSSSDELESSPHGVCCVNDTGLCVVMKHGITHMSISDSGLISRGTTFHLTPSFDYCTAVASFMDNVVVSGVKVKTIYWCVVSIQDGRHDNLHKVCRGGWSRMTSKENMAYFSCLAYSPEDIGVYGFNLTNPSQPPYTYKSKELSSPRGITVDDNGYLFVCDEYYISIHHLTEKCELVAIFLEGIPRRPYAIFWDRGILYLTAWESNVISRYETPHQVLPKEILRMDENSKQLFKEALKKGEEKVYNIRVMVVGHGGVGKTTLIKRLLGKIVNIQERFATEGIDVDMHCCDVSVESFEWKVRQTESEDSKEDALILRVAKVVNKKTLRAKVSGQPKQENRPSKKHPDNKKLDRGIRPTVKSKIKISQENKISKSKELVPYTDGGERQPKLNANRGNISEVSGIPNTDLKGDALHSLLCQKAHTLPRSTDEHASLAIWDFAGQYAFYTTHQTFMTRRAIYLLVSDVSKTFYGPVDDECYLDSRGNIQCSVQELADVWLNSIHSCASSPEEGIPPVILVGTHVDQIKGDRHEFCESYFKEVRTYVKDKPSRFHLVNEEFAIDNTLVDSKLERLKTKIALVASQQKYWGEKIPAQWLPLEQALMKLRHDGRKVIPRRVLEDLATTHQIATAQLDLFLRFQHDIGTILYFSTEQLKEKIVLDPKWMIDVLKSLINANDMFVMRNNPKVSDKVPLFKDYGMLYPELIDAIWTKEQCPEFHDNKEHILLLMEQLNIIARPRSYVASESKAENYFLVPCMIHQATPTDIINPKPHSEMGSSSVLCYVFVGKFLPTPIFNRLLAACLTEWPLAKKNSKNLIFCGCSVFEVDPCHELTLHFKNYVIFVRVTKMSKMDKTPDSDICIRARDFISANLSKLIGDQCQSLRFDWYIQCTQSEADCLDSMIPVTRLRKSKESACSSHGAKHVVVSHDLLKFWFKDEKELGSGGGAVKKQPKLPQTDKGASDTKSKLVLSKQQQVDTTTSPAVQIPKQIKPKLEVPAKRKVSSLPLNMQNKKPTERQLGRLSMKIGHELFPLGLELGLSGADIQQIQTNYHHTETHCLKILVKWNDRCGDKATFGNLEKAFISVGIDVDIFNSLETAGDMVSCLPPELLDKQPDDKQLNRICSGIGTGHVHLGVELEVPFSRIDQILTEHKDSVHRQCFEIMKEWRQRQASQATFRKLQQAFSCVNINPDILKKCELNPSH